MAVDTDMILTVGRFIPDAGAPEGRTVRMEDYLAALYIRMNDLLHELDGRTAALESAARSAAQSAARSAAATGGETV